MLSATRRVLVSTASKAASSSTAAAAAGGTQCTTSIASSIHHNHHHHQNNASFSSLAFHKHHTQQKSIHSTINNNNNNNNKQQIRTMFIQTESTPNPESIKFLPNRQVLPPSFTIDDSTTTGFYATRNDKVEIAKSPLSKMIFDNIDGVKSVYLGADFITVTKYAEAHWKHVKTEVFGVIMDFYDSGKEAVCSSEGEVITDTTILEDDDEVVAMIKELLESRIRPAVQEDGGDIRYVGFAPDTGLVSVQLAGSCVGCPSSSVTLKNGVENMLMHYIPEVTGVDAIEEEEDDEGSSGGGGGGDVVVENTKGDGKMKSYEERLAAAGIPFSD